MGSSTVGDNVGLLVGTYCVGVALVGGLVGVLCAENNFVGFDEWI